MPASFRYFAVFLFFASFCARIYAEPQRIVSLAPSCTEILAALALQNRLVGITEHTEYPTEVLRLPRIGSYVNLNIEAILALKPDLILATDDGNPKFVLDRLKSLSLNVLVLNLRTYEQIQQSILEIGRLFHREARAGNEVKRMSNIAECVASKTRHVKKPSILFVYDRYPVVTAGKGTFTDQLIEMAGGRSVAHDVTAPYPRLTMESIIALDPDLIIETSANPDRERKKRMEWWNGWQQVRAVREGQIRIIGNDLDRPSQRIVFGLVLLAKTIHPQLFAQDTCLPDEKETR